MKFLLTSSGITNPSITDALVGLLGKPISESTALIVPTGIYPFPGGSAGAWGAIAGKAPGPLTELGWKSVGVLELTALPSLRTESWVPTLRDTDALLVWGGDVLYLCHWMRESGLADLLPALTDLVYVGVSAGSITMTPYNCDAEFDLQFVPDGSDMGVGAEKSLGFLRVPRIPPVRPPPRPGDDGPHPREVGVRGPRSHLRDRRPDCNPGGRRRSRRHLGRAMEGVQPLTQCSALSAS